MIARNSTFTYKDKAADVREISEKFGVRYILEGSVQLSGETIRVAARFLDGADGRHVWAQTFDRPVADIFAVQDEIAIDVARSIYGKTISGGALRRTGGTRNIDAWAENVAGGALLNVAMPDSILRAEPHFERAIDLDPEFSDPYAGLAHVHWFRARYYLSKDPPATLAAAADFAEKALSLDPKNPSAHSALAMTRLMQHRCEEAVAAVLAGVDAAPGDAFSQASAAWVLTFAARPGRRFLTMNARYGCS